MPPSAQESRTPTAAAAPSAARPAKPSHEAPFADRQTDLIDRPPDLSQRGRDVCQGARRTQGGHRVGGGQFGRGAGGGAQRAGRDAPSSGRSRHRAPRPQCRRLLRVRATPPPAYTAAAYTQPLATPPHLPRTLLHPSSLCGLMAALTWWRAVDCQVRRLPAHLLRPIRGQPRHTPARLAGQRHRAVVGQLHRRLRMDDRADPHP
eukprot:2520839-Prymnesium_polylepis.1